MTLCCSSLHPYNMMIFKGHSRTTYGFHVNLNPLVLIKTFQITVKGC